MPSVCIFVFTDGRQFGIISVLSWMARNGPTRNARRLRGYWRLHIARDYIEVSRPIPAERNGMSSCEHQGNHGVPGTAAGFAYQFGRALWWLATETGDFSVGVECIDDLSFQKQGGVTLLEQDKHSIQESGQPVSDRSVALWKTLSIWSGLLADSPKNYHFLLVTNKPVPPDALVRRLSDATTDGEVSAVAQKLLEIAGQPSDTIEPYCSSIRRCEPTVLQRLIRWTKLASSDSAKTEWEGIRKETIEGLCLPSSLLSQDTVILDALLGWLVDTCMNAWKSRRSATITSQSFFNAVDRVKERMRRQYARERPPSQVPVAPGDLHGIAGNLFVQQLRLVEIADSEIEESICDFIRYGKEVVRLTETGEYTPEDWRDFEVELEKRWGQIFRRAERLYSHEEEKARGERTYRETTTDYLARLKGQPTDYIYFTTGAYHRLADELDVGWHPRFLDLLRGGIDG